MTVTLGIQQISVENGVILIPTLTDSNSTLSGYSLTHVTCILNDLTNSAGFVEKLIPHLDDDDQPLDRYFLTSPVLLTGKSYFLKIVHHYKNSLEQRLSVSSNKISVNIKSRPATPIANVFTVRSGDENVSINISSQYSELSNDDGYSLISKIMVYISKVGSDDPDDFIVEELLIDSVKGYDHWYQVNALLENGAEHELAFKVINNFGQSDLSNTFTFEPSDLPSQIDSLAAFHAFNNPENPGVLSDNSGDIYFLWGRPNDYDALLADGLPVITYVILKYEMIFDNVSNKYVPKPNSSVEEVILSVPATGSPSYQLQTPIDLGGGKYVHYKHVFSGSSSTLGKVYSFKVLGKNSNGDGPQSEASNNVFSFANPELQPFTLHHITQQVATTGLDVTAHTGDLKIVVNSLSNLNGAADIFKTAELGSGLQKKIVRNYTMHLRVETDTVVPNKIFDGEVDLVQEYTSTTTGGTTSYTLLDQWSVLLSSVIVEPAKSIIDLLVLGHKYRFNVSRKGTDPLNTNFKLLSLASVVVRTQFKSPDAVRDIEAYSVNDDFTPIRSGDSPAIRIVFNQVGAAAFNGCDSFGTIAEYVLFSGSQPVLSVNKILHDSTIVTPREFIFPSSLGNVNNFYVRYLIKNTELNIDIQSTESSPSVSEKAIDYVAAPTNLQTTPGINTLAVTWVRQTLSGLAGNSSVDVRNIAILVCESNPLELKREVSVPYTTHNSNSQTVTFTGLTTGAIYKLFIVATSLYKKHKLDSALGLAFNDSNIRKNFVTTAVTIVGPPNAPENVRVFPGSSSVTFNYDSPSVLDGHNASNFAYHFLLNQDFSLFPIQESGPRQVSVADVSGTDEAIVSTGYKTLASSNNRENSVPLEPNTLYKYAMWIVSHVGNQPIVNRDDKLNGENGTELQLVPLHIVPARTMVGNMFVGPDPILFSNNIPLPSVISSSADGSVTMVIDKPNPSVGELVVTVDNEDAFDTTNQNILNFDTRNVKTALNAVSGLFALENAGSNLIIGGVNYGALGYDFKVLSIDGQQKYSLTFRNLVNGRLHKFRVRFSNTVDGYSFFGGANLQDIAAEAPPTVVRALNFDIASRVINLSWNFPLNSGGAGVGSNGQLRYEVQIWNSLNTTTLFAKDEISATNFQVDATNFLSITDGTTYRVRVFSYYMKNGNRVVLNDYAALDAVRPGPIPVPSTVTAIAGDNKITVNITTAGSSTQTAYPLSSIHILYKIRGSTTGDVLAKTFHGPFTGLNSLNYDIIGLRNGDIHDVVVQHVKNYNYAQAPATVSLNDNTPFGTPTVIFGAQVTGNIKARNMEVILNGSGPLTGIVALGKSQDSNIIGIVNLSQALANLPAITTSGAATDVLAANQIAKFVVDFGSTIPTSLNSSICVVNTQRGSDAAALGNHFNSGL
jgi:hypothetical protein